MRGIPVIPCGCSHKTGTVRRSIRDIFAEWEVDHPHLKESLLSAMGNIDPTRLLDTRYLQLEDEETLEPEPELFSILS